MSSESTPPLPSRFVLAFKAFFRVFGDRRFAEGVFRLLRGLEASPAPVTATPAKPAAPPQPNLHPLQLLTLLQREGRLVDFLMEDLTGLPDAQIGVAVREVHQKCRRALLEHVPLEPVVTQAEESTLTIPSGYDPSALRVVGNVGTHPPYSGIVRHRGWRARDLQMQPLPSGQNPQIVAPAEIEVP
jgi:hypothetical protein